MAKEVRLSKDSPAELWSDPTYGPILRSHYGESADPNVKKGEVSSGPLDFIGDVARDTWHNAAGFAQQNEQDYQDEAGSPAAQFTGRILGSLPYYLGPRVLGGLAGAGAGTAILPGAGTLAGGYLGQFLGGSAGAGGYETLRRLDELHDQGTQPNFGNVAPYVLPAIAQQAIPGGFGQNLGTRIGTGAATGWLTDIASRQLGPEDASDHDSWAPGANAAFNAALPIGGAFMGRALQKVANTARTASQDIQSMPYFQEPPSESPGLYSNPGMNQWERTGPSPNLPAVVSPQPAAESVQKPLTGQVVENALPNGQPYNPLELTPSEQEANFNQVNASPGAGMDANSTLDWLNAARSNSVPGSPEYQMIDNAISEILSRQGGSPTGAGGKPQI